MINLNNLYTVGVQTSQTPRRSALWRAPPLPPTVLYHTILYYTILYYTILYYTISYHFVLGYAILYYTILYYTIPYYSMLKRTSARMRLGLIIFQAAPNVLLP